MNTRMDQIGRYRIEGELGRGAMGVVYRARDTAIGRTVAIKTIRLNELANADEQTRLRERLFREAQSAGMLSHPNIVTIYDIAEEGGVAYVAMECVNGQTLDRVVAAGPPDGQLILMILSQTAAALDYAHKRGIVHRDIKPANIMIDEGPVAKITDFGVAKIQSHELTQAGSMVGTPSYMSPEQIQGKAVTGKSDQFSLAVIAYELLTGEKPFSAESIAALAFRIVNEQPTPVQQLNPTLDWPVDTVLRRALAKNPEDRYPSCSDFVFALENACRVCRKWKPLAPGASQSMATLADKPVIPVILPEVKTAPMRRLPETPEAVPAPLRWTRYIAMVMLGGVAAGALFLGAIRYFDDPSDEPPAAASTSAAPEPAPVKKPSPMPTLPADPDPAAADPPPEEEAEPEPAAPPPAPRTVPAKPAEASAARIVTNPPGAFVVVDGSSSHSCTSPCSIELPPGRHTLAATLGGYRRALRIFETPNEGEIFVHMDRASGTVMVRSEPRGASIVVDGEARQEKTPAVLTLSLGPHTIEVAHEGQRESHQVTVRESAITNVQVSFR